MNIDEMIVKWDEQIALHRRVCEDALMYTKEDRLKNSHYAQAICAVIADLKQVKNLSSNTVLADSLPPSEVRFIATRFAHQCRLKGVVTNNDTVNLYDEWIKDFRW